MAKYSSSIHESWFPLFAKWEPTLDAILAEVYPSNTNNTNNTKLKTFPPHKYIFNAFAIPIKEIKLVLLGQDCYHGEGQAMGLAFSVPQSVKIPPSLVNIFKELNMEFPERGYTFTHGDLTSWTSRESIFLLNSALTVKQSSPLSHIKKWEAFTNDVIKFILECNVKCIFLLLGNYAKNKTKIINTISGGEARIVCGVHPSPLSAHQGFFNSGIFQKVEILLDGKINWQN
jgi:uracil-DNA glycosylase